MHVAVSDRVVMWFGGRGSSLQTAEAHMWGRPAIAGKLLLDETMPVGRV